MKRKILLCCCCLIGGGTATLFAQQGIITSGGEATGTGGKVSYSVGQIDYKDASGTNGNIIQGLQQPFEISEVSGIDIKGIELSSSVYPNPSQGNLTLKIENYNYENLTYQIYDELGKMIVNKRIEDRETNIGLSNYANAKYFLKVINKDQELKTYKIVKLN